MKKHHTKMVFRIKIYRTLAEPGFVLVHFPLMHVSMMPSEFLCTTDRALILPKSPVKL